MSSSVGMVPAPCRFEVGGVVDLPGPGNLEDWPAFEQNSSSVVIPDVRFGNKINSLR